MMPGPNAETVPFLKGYSGSPIQTPTRGASQFLIDSFWIKYGMKSSQATNEIAMLWSDDMHFKVLQANIFPRQL